MTSLHTIIEPWINPEYILKSRIHRLNQTFERAEAWIKREDELSSGITGSKFRKFASLIPFFIREGYDEIVLIGSAQSNNIAGILQLLNENRIRAKLILLESNEAEYKGNLLWTSLLHDIYQTTWVSRKNWPGVNKLAEKYRLEKESEGKRVFVLPEGGAVLQAMPGAASLAEDIAAGEEANAIRFDHVFIDSGSGVSAAGLILGFHLMQQARNVHITLIAGSENEFMVQYRQLGQAFLEAAGILQGQESISHLHFHLPSLAPAFGSVNSSVLQQTIRIAREEGILMDPVYSVKHLLTMRHVIESRKLSGNILFIYNGGSLGLSGFMNKLSVRV